MVVQCKPTDCKGKLPWFYQLNVPAVWGYREYNLDEKSLFIQLTGAYILVGQHFFFENRNSYLPGGMRGCCCYKRRVHKSYIVDGMFSRVTEV